MSKADAFRSNAYNVGLKLDDETTMPMPFNIEYFLDETISEASYYTLTVRCNSANIAGQADALFINNLGYEYFHPSYGSALFPAEHYFFHWFRRFLPEIESGSFNIGNGDWCYVLRYKPNIRAPQPQARNDVAIIA